MDQDLVLGVVGALGVLVGLVGTLVPVVPGLLLVLVATAGTLVLQGVSGAGWLLVVLLVGLGLAGTAASTVLPARRAAADGAPARTLALAAVGAVVGFVVLPVLGLVVGGVLGLLLAEQQRLGGWAPAWASARRVVGAYGVGVLLELLVGMVMGAVWLTAFVARAG